MNTEDEIQQFKALLLRLVVETKWVYDDYLCNACGEYLTWGHAGDCPLELARALLQVDAPMPLQPSQGAASARKAAE